MHQTQQSPPHKTLSQSRDCESVLYVYTKYFTENFTEKTGTDLGFTLLEAIPAHKISCFSWLKWKLCNRAAAIFTRPISRMHFSLTPPTLSVFLLLKAISTYKIARISRLKRKLLYLRAASTALPVSLKHFSVIHSKNTITHTSLYFSTMLFSFFFQQILKTPLYLFQLRRNNYP